MSQSNTPQARKERVIFLVGKAIKDGALNRLPCERCGNKRSVAHHEDYSKPLEIVWLCLSHHSRRHWQIGRRVRIGKNIGTNEFLKVMLSKENSEFVRSEAERLFTTPPRVVNKIVADHYTKSK